MKSFGPSLPVYKGLAAGVRRLVAPNPSLMTGPGTNTYLFGINEVAVLDPGPVIEAHIARIQEEAAAPIVKILVTHTHPDHSPGAAVLAAATGAELVGCPPPGTDHQDSSFTPDRILGDGESITVDGIGIESIRTPGHASNHVCYRHVGLNWVFTGDHVIDGSTVVINPPDGDMQHYLESLQKLKALDCAALAPGHGDLIQNPTEVIDWIIEHRLQREARVLAGLRENPGLTSMQLVPHVYTDVDPSLYGWAERSLLAHLLKLRVEGFAVTNNEKWTAL